jgi:2-keto-4-pentenoate hydratase/2-oxohepta-3-ene-1,7-dioic acid hydratase in catechol pathway
MRCVTFSIGSQPIRRLGVVDENHIIDMRSIPPGKLGHLPGSLMELIASGPARWGEIAELLNEDSARHSGTRHQLSDVRWHAPLRRPTKNLVCLGRNYAGRAIEAAGQQPSPPVPRDPVIFTKAPTAVTGPFDDIEVDREATDQVDWEVELGVVIGVGGKNIDRTAALDHVFGYTVPNDITRAIFRRLTFNGSKGRASMVLPPGGPAW